MARGAQTQNPRSEANRHGVTMRIVAVLLSILIATSAAASDRGKVTNLPLPRYVSIKAGEANVRRGPSLTHRIDWVFQRRHLPVQITAEHGHWRRVRDREGAGGWVHYSLLSGVRYVEIMEADTALHREPKSDSLLVAKAEPGVIAKLGDCNPVWCRVTAEGISGWVAKDVLWGVEPGEVRD